MYAHLWIVIGFPAISQKSQNTIPLLPEHKFVNLSSIISRSHLILFLFIHLDGLVYPQPCEYFVFPRDQMSPLKWPMT